MSIEKAYNQWAKIYDSNENKTRDLDTIATRTILGQYSFNSVLELGCGTGKNTQWLADKSNRVIALDLSDEMLKIAKTKVSSSKVKFQKADLNDELAIEDGFADLVSCNLVLEHIEKLHHVFEQAYKKSTKKGLFFISELHPMKQYAGTQARCEGDDDETILVDAFVHHTSDYINAAKKCRFKLVQLDEWFDDDKGSGLPRLISFLFEK